MAYCGASHVKPTARRAGHKVLKLEGKVIQEESLPHQKKNKKSSCHYKYPTIFNNCILGCSSEEEHLHLPFPGYLHSFTDKMDKVVGT